jgi:hypothetical protein
VAPPDGTAKPWKSEQRRRPRHQRATPGLDPPWAVAPRGTPLAGLLPRCLCEEPKRQPLNRCRWQVGLPQPQVTSPQHFFPVLSGGRRKQRGDSDCEREQKNVWTRAPERPVTPARWACGHGSPGRCSQRCKMASLLCLSSARRHVSVVEPAEPVFGLGGFGSTGGGGSDVSKSAAAVGHATAPGARPVPPLRFFLQSIGAGDSTPRRDERAPRVVESSDPSFRSQASHVSSRIGSGFGSVVGGELQGPGYVPRYFGRSARPRLRDTVSAFSAG